jgi:hypothetical protein
VVLENNYQMIARVLRYRFRTAVSHIPWAYFPMVKLKKGHGDAFETVSKSTELVIEAFPRSGNTFAVVALSLAQENQLRLAHHCHAPAQIIHATRLRKPALLIIRNPSDAVLSFVIRHPEISLEVSLKAWISFHSRVLPHLRNVVVAHFNQVTTNLGDVTARINNKFGMHLKPFQHTEDNVHECFQIIAARNANRFGQGRVDENGVARPSEERVRQKQKLASAWLSSTTVRSRETAQVIYAEFKSFWMEE